MTEHDEAVRKTWTKCFGGTEKEGNNMFFKKTEN